MLSKTPEEAVEVFIEPLRQAAGCVTSWPLIGTGYRPAEVPHTASFAPLGTTVPLDAAGGGRRGIQLLVSVRNRIQRETARRHAWRATLLDYFYHVLDHEGREILAYHWHPELVGPSFPHLHVSGRLPALDLGPQFAPVSLGEMHLPTDQVTLAALARLLIIEFGVAPQRADWGSVLTTNDKLERPNR